MEPPEGSQQVSVAEEPPGTNIPATVIRLVGRTESVQRLCDLVSAYRVVTLTGPGGIGKTTVALEVARRVQNSLPTVHGWSSSRRCQLLIWCLPPLPGCLD